MWFGWASVLLVEHVYSATNHVSGENIGVAHTGSMRIVDADKPTPNPDIRYQRDALGLSSQRFGTWFLMRIGMVDDTVFP